MKDIMKKGILFGIIVILFLISGFLLLRACTARQSTHKEAAANTQAAQTVDAQMTLDAGNTAIAELTQIAAQAAAQAATQYAQETITAATETALAMLPTPTTPPTAGPTATPEATPTSQPTPTATPLPVPCDWAEFVTDVTIPDGTTLSPSQNFTKTWRLKNIGTCTWTTEYDLVFFNGDQMGGAASSPLAGDVPPGSTVDISIDLVTPAAPGEYTGYWQLRNAQDVLFGMGPAANTPFYVKVTVVAGSTVVYDMTANYCLAQWQNSAGILACPTDSQDENVGFVYRQDAPVLETGSQENDPALITHPNNGEQNQFPMLGEQGITAGVYPSTTFQAGDHFQAVIGCLNGYDQCNVLFYLMLQKTDGTYEVINSWQEVYDGNLTDVDVDLSPYAGMEVRLILAVVENGDPIGDYAFWLHPRIVR
jgi:hypothetical protein